MKASLKSRNRIAACHVGCILWAALFPLGPGQDVQVLRSSIVRSLISQELASAVLGSELLHNSMLELADRKNDWGLLGPSKGQS